MGCGKTGPCDGIRSVAGGQGDKDGMLIQRYFSLTDLSDKGIDRLIICRTRQRGGAVRARYCPACGEDVSAGWPVEGRGEPKQEKEG